MRNGGQQVPSDFENRDRSFPAHGGEVVQKLVEAVPGREVVEKFFTGIRVPTKTVVPPRISGSL